MGPGCCCLCRMSYNHGISPRRVCGEGLLCGTVHRLLFQNLPMDSGTNVSRTFGATSDHLFNLVHLSFQGAMFSVTTGGHIRCTVLVFRHTLGSLDPPNSVQNQPGFSILSCSSILPIDGDKARKKQETKRKKQIPFSAKFWFFTSRRQTVKREPVSHNKPDSSWLIEQNQRSVPIPDYTKRTNILTSVSFIFNYLRARSHQRGKKGWHERCLAN